MPEPKRLHVITWGCQMNVYDSARMADTLAPLGYTPATGPEDADMVILNTCHIRERAAEKVFSELGRLRVIKDARAAAGHPTVLAVAGCVAQAEGEALLQRAPYVDIVMGPQTYHRLPEMVARAARAAGSVIETDFATIEKFDALPEAAASQGLTAFLTIQEGCDKFCSFCVVPYTRGAEISRPPHAVLAEAGRMVAGGTREITLLGQNVNAWTHSGWTLAGLVRALADIPGPAPHPLHHQPPAGHGRRPDRRAPRTSPAADAVPAPARAIRVRPHAGGDEPPSHRRRLLRRWWPGCGTPRPDLALSSDFIVGHPGETDADHAATHGTLVREIGFATAFAFKYSPRPGTPASGAPGQVAEPVKDARLQELQAACCATARPRSTQRQRGPHPARAGHRGRAPARVRSAGVRRICSRCIFLDRIVGLAMKCRCRSQPPPPHPFQVFCNRS